MNNPLLDLSYLIDTSSGDAKYIYEVLTLFVESFPVGLSNLENLIRNTDDYCAIHKQAHSLKSSASIVQIRDVYEAIAKIDALSREKTGKAEIILNLNIILNNFNKALPLIQSERRKYLSSNMTSK
jgi:HPt (histidine-containing phosphotransfer) domain-containing protein